MSHDSRIAVIHLLHFVICMFLSLWTTCTTNLPILQETKKKPSNSSRISAPHWQTFPNYYSTIGLAFAPFQAAASTTTTVSHAVIAFCPAAESGSRPYRYHHLSLSLQFSKSPDSPPPLPLLAFLGYLQKSNAYQIILSSIGYCLLLFIMTILEDGQTVFKAAIYQVGKHQQYCYTLKTGQVLHLAFLTFSCASEY